MKTTITTFNGNISTEAWINKHGNEWHVAIVQNYTNGETEFMQGKDFKTMSGAERFIEKYRNNKREAFNRGELVTGVEVK